MASDLDPEIRHELRSLSKPVADLVARRLVASGRQLDVDPAGALGHALVARRLAPRLASVREAAGLAAYHASEWASAIKELRTFHRLTGRGAHLAVIADSERALGRPERAIDLYRSSDVEALDPAEAIELLIVAAGARADLGQVDAALAMLQVPELRAQPPQPWTARLQYAYADMLLANDRRDEARDWFARAAELDDELTTDAAQRLLDLDGVVLGDTDDDPDHDLDDADADSEADAEALAEADALADPEADTEALADAGAGSEPADEARHDQPQPTREEQTRAGSDHTVNAARPDELERT